jgi:hypothetical protein
MTVSSSASRNQYTATAGQTVFAYTFEIVSDDDIVVLKNGVTLTKTADYTVSGVGSDSGGNVTLVVGATAGDILTLYRDMAYERTTDYTNAGDFLAADVNNDFDRLWIATQQVNEEVNRSLKAPVTDPLTIDMTIPAKASRVGKLLRFNATTGDPEAVATSDVVGSGAFNVYNFTGDGSDTTFILGTAPGVENNTQVYIDGVYQQKNTYTLSGSTITFSAAPPNLSTIEVMVMVPVPLNTVSASGVSFVQSGSTDTRTVQAKLEESVSVKDFGAVGDGTTDDTAAIQAAINSLANWPSDNVYKAVFFPPGTYKVAGTLSIPLSATYSAFFGSGNNSSRIVFENSTGVTLNAQSTVWSNLYFEGDNGVTAFHAFQTNNAADCDVRFDTCLFENVDIGLRIVGRGASFYNCTLNTFDDGVLLQIEAPNPFTEGPAVTQKIRTGMRRYIINGCDIDGAGVLVKVPNTNTGDSYINGLVISGCNGSSIRQLFVGTSLRNSAITGNTFLSSRQWTGLKESYIQAKIIENVVITGNVIRQQYDYLVSPPNTQSRINNLVAVINDPLDYTDTTTTTNVNLSGLYIKDNIISDIQEKLVLAYCYANDVHIESNTLPRFTEGQTATNHLIEVAAQIINLSVVRNTMTINTTPGTAPILVNLGANTNCSNIVVEGNILPTAHTLLSAEPSQNIAINGEFNFSPSITIGGSATGILYGTQEGNYYRLGPMVFATMRIVLTSKGAGSGEVRITGLPFTPAPIFNSTGGLVTSDAWSGNIIEYAGTIGSPDLQYLDVRADGTVRIYKSGLATLQNSDIDNTFAININVMYFTRR